jgi:hypothetical protein
MVASLAEPRFLLLLSRCSLSGYGRHLHRQAVCFVFFFGTWRLRALPWWHDWSPPCNRRTCTLKGWCCGPSASRRCPSAATYDQSRSVEPTCLSMPLLMTTDDYC